MREAAKVKVALVEDDARTRATWRHWLSQTPTFSCVHEFDGAEQALLGWSKNLAEVAVIDLKLPGLNGTQALRRLKDRFPSLRCLVVTVYHDSNSIFEALAAGADGYILKSAPPSEFIEALDDVLAGRAPMSPAVSRKVLQFFRRVGSNTHPGLERLTAREEEILVRISQGAQNKEVALQLGVSVNAIKHSLSNLYRKLEVSSRTEAIARLADARFLRNDNAA